jgi:PKD repeat protein
MNNNLIKNLSVKLVLLALLALPEIAGAQTYFTATTTGDVDAGFRKTGSFQEAYEMVVYLGNITNFLAVPAGATVNITNYTRQQITNMCPNNLANLQWSVFSSFSGDAPGVRGPLTNSFGIFPVETCWYTVPRTNVTVQTTPVGRFPQSNESNLRDAMEGANSGASTLSANLVTTNTYNNTLVVLEPVSFQPQYLLTAYIGDSSAGADGHTSTYGDFGGVTFDSFSVENTTPSPFSSPTVSDFYMNVPTESSGRPIIDPLTGSASGSTDYIGYFTVATNGTMTFTRAATVAAPTISSVAAAVTNGFSPFQVVFGDATSGTITSYVWNFGNGTIITNTTGASVTNTYATSGNYTVTLTVYGPGGSSTKTLGSYVVASPTPKLSQFTVNGSSLVISGTNGPAGVQYRILTATNLTSATWTAVLTNTVSSSGIYGFTNSMTKPAAYFRLVSP